MWTPYIEQFFPHMLEYTSQRKFNKHSGEINPKEFKEILKTRGGKKHVYQFFGSNQWVYIFLKMKEHQKKRVC